MTIYKTGTVSVTNGDAAVTGSGTAWAVALVAGGMFSCAGVSVPIASVDSDTSLTLAYDWPGTTAMGAVYAIARENSEAADIVDLNDKLSRVLVTLSLAGITPDASGSLTDRAAITLGVGDKGFLFLHAEIGVAFAFYRWNGTAWDGPFPVADAASGGPVSSLVGGNGITVDSTNPAVPVVSLGVASQAQGDILFRGSSTWQRLAKGTALQVLRQNGALTAPEWATAREVLTANRTYYVRTDGNDANSGLVNNASGGFLTVQKAINVVAALDISIYNVTIQVADGTYTGVNTVNGAWVGSGTVTIIGNTTAPANVVFQGPTSANGVVLAANGARISLSSFKIVANGTLGVGLYATTGGSITWTNLEFGACTHYHMYCENGCRIIGGGSNIVISGGAANHIICAGYVRITGFTITLTGTPAFSTFITTSRGGGLVEYYSGTFTGSATGVRYNVGAFGTVFSNGGGASFYPGSTAGSVNALGVYS